MNDDSLIGLFVRPLNKLRIPYMVTGGVASVVYGEPRLTRDIDLVLQLRPEDAGRLAAAWSAHDFYVPPVEVIEEESRRTAFGHFNVIHHQTTLRADVYGSSSVRHQGVAAGEEPRRPVMQTHPRASAAGQSFVSDIDPPCNTMLLPTMK